MTQSQTLNRKQRRALEKNTKKQDKTQMAWMASKDLKPGDKIVTKDGRTGTVKAINATPGLRTVHNFAVEDHHTYFVGAGAGIWVHNRYDVEEKIADDHKLAAKGDLSALERLRKIYEAFLPDTSSMPQGISPKETVEWLREKSAEKIFASDQSTQDVIDVISPHYKNDPIGAMVVFMKRLGIEPPIKKDIVTAVNSKKGKMSTIEGIVVHRTSTDKYPKYTTKAPHFTVDKDGTIYINLDSDRIGVHAGGTRKTLDTYGSQTSTRYPGNSSTIGIEVVGEIKSSADQVIKNAGKTNQDIVKTRWQELSIRQAVSTRYLVEDLRQTHNLLYSQVHAHEVIRAKTPGEGLFVIDSIGLASEFPDTRRTWRNNSRGGVNLIETTSGGLYHSYGSWTPPAPPPASVPTPRLKPQVPTP